METLYIVKDLQENNDRFSLFTTEEYKVWLKNGALCEYEVNKGFYNEDDLSTICHLDNMLFFKRIINDIFENNLDSDNIRTYLRDFQYEIKEIEF